MSTIPARLVELRRLMGLTQERFAAKIGVNPKTYARSENADRPLEAGELAQMREIGVNIDWLLTGEGEMTRAGVAQSALSESRAAASRGGEGVSGDVRDGKDDELQPRMTVEEVGLVLRRTRTAIDDAIKKGGWQPPRATEEAVLTLLFTLALRGADATVADIVEFLGFLRQDIERRSLGG
jgi:transcriptional regulator with XRE-family HTH domain